ncbi:MAG: DUF262 domain-containing protein [Nitrospinae bacterium]|nr:DUF262 domain-containing protein [Nitrospinota bacterium]MBF0633728.1 DUF262 domain-containing protein [Nitrospinota bacterium]
MKLPELTAKKVKELRRHLLSRSFAVPKLQRNFVWDSRRAAKLLDSMYRGMPIGSLFLWEMDRKSANLIRQSAEVLPSFNPINKKIWFVIDGQQRLSVIYQAFKAEVKKNDAGREIDFGRLCFVVSPTKTKENSSRIVYRKPVGLDSVPLNDILDPDWKGRMPTKAKWFVAKIKDCRKRLLDYPVPVVMVRAATLDDIGEIFIRINSQGMRITSADRAFARIGKLDVRAMADELRHQVRDQVFAIGGIEPILMGFNLVAERPHADGDPPKLDAMALRWSKRIDKDEHEKEKFRKLWYIYQTAFLSAVNYLHNRFPVHDESYLPSVNMLATLAVFFFHHPSQPDKYQASEIRKWFWATGVAQRYSGRGYHRNIVADAKMFEALAHGKRRRFVFPDLLDPVIDIQAAEYASHSGRTRAFFCLLLHLEPRYLDNGEPIFLQNVLGHSERKHRHHIFPQAQMSKHFKSRIYNRLCNICFLVASDNQKIGMQLPRSYLTQYREAGHRQFKGVMRSHLIPVGDDSGIWEKGIVSAFNKFQKQRLKLICAEFEKVAGIKLFRKN